MRIRDLGFLPEGEVHSRAADDTPYEMAQAPERYPPPPHPRGCRTRLIVDDPDPFPRCGECSLTLIVRHVTGRRWAYSCEAKKPFLLLELYTDEAAYPRLTAAHALATFGETEDLGSAVGTLLDARQSRSPASL